MAKTASITVPIDSNIKSKITLAAMQEAKDIASGKIAVKNYVSATELFVELDNEDSTSS